MLTTNERCAQFIGALKTFLMVNIDRNIPHSTDPKAHDLDFTLPTQQEGVYTHRPVDKQLRS